MFLDIGFGGLGGWLIVCWTRDHSTAVIIIIHAHRYIPKNRYLFKDGQTDIFLWCVVGGYIGNCERFRTF